MSGFFIVKFEVTILGCGAALPTMRHHPTGQVVNIHDKYFLVDCGEGTQMQLRKYKVKMQRINHVFISHLHGDHYFGLNGLLSTMCLLGRTKALHVYAPQSLEQLFNEQVRLTDFYLTFPLVWHATSHTEKTKVYEDNTLSVWSFPVEHRIPCTGFLFCEKQRKPAMNRAAIALHKLTFQEIIALKNGYDLCRLDHTVLRSNELTEQQPPGRSYAFCADTRYSERVIEAVKGVDLLYHEATFSHDFEKRAAQTHHSTAKQAGEVAYQAKVGRLIIGHFSARYTDDTVLLEEAKSVFQNTALADEGCTFIP
jgi:ribonuclease Z